MIFYTDQPDTVNKSYALFKINERWHLLDFRNSFMYRNNIPYLSWYAGSDSEKRVIPYTDLNSFLTNFTTIINDKNRHIVRALLEYMAEDQKENYEGTRSS